MNTLQIFQSNQFGHVRATTISNEPWFVGKDVAEALGYSNPRKAIGDHVDEEDKGVTKCDTLGGTQDLTIINESGLYSLIMASKLPTAKQFKRWVTSEVLPSIRKQGSYTQPDMTNQIMDHVLLDQLRKAQERLNQWRELSKTWEKLTKDACSRYDQARKQYDEFRAYRDKCRGNIELYQKQVDALVNALTLPAAK